ncbi:hypothetical protein F66182_5836 [Fusarium sp. NRRL 66182]|nr:hypothetical protein F66182_5836 [Fusarium sp. NRRL 66182]
MKYSFAALAIAATVAVAAPAPEPYQDLASVFEGWTTPFCPLYYDDKPCSEVEGKGDKEADTSCEAGRKWCHKYGPVKTKREASPAPWGQGLCEDTKGYCERWAGKGNKGVDAECQKAEWGCQSLNKREAAPEPQKWCMWIGQPCWKAKAKREAEAAPEPKRNNNKWCMWIGQPCWKAKAKREASPEPQKWCMWIGQPCWKAKRDAGEALSDSLHATRSLHDRSPTELLAGGAAAEAKRSIVELANMVALGARSDSGAYFDSLKIETHFPEFNSTSTAAVKRDEAALKQDKRWCMWIGQPCWKAKRAAEAVYKAIDGKRDESASPANFDPEHFEEKRDLHAIKQAARSIIDSLEE